MISNYGRPLNDPSVNYAYRFEITDNAGNWQVLCKIANSSKQCGGQAAFYRKEVINGKNYLGAFIDYGSYLNYSTGKECIDAGLGSADPAPWSWGSGVRW